VTLGCAIVVFLFADHVSIRPHSAMMKLQHHAPDSRSTAIDYLFLWLYSG